MARKDYEIHTAGYDALAAAIIKQTVKDYVTAKREGKLYSVADIQKFFLSDYCHMLCNIDGKTLIELADAHCERLRIEREKKKGKKRCHQKK